MFSALSGWVTSAAEAVNKISDQGLDAVRQTGVLDALESVAPKPNTGSAAATSSDKELSVKDITAPPAAWTGSSDEWVWCVEAALADPNSCAITPAKLHEDQNLWQEIQTMATDLMTSAKSTASPANTGATDAAKPPAEAATELLAGINDSYTPAADLVEFIQHHAAIYRVRSYVVPLFTSDEDYWLNIGWRFKLYRQCADAGRLLHVMRTLSKLPLPLRDIAEAEKRTADEYAEEERKAAAARAAAREVSNGANGEESEEEEEEAAEYVPRAHLKDNREYWLNMDQRYQAEQEKFAWLRDTQERARKEMELARGNVKLLGSLLQRKEAGTALGVSVSDSCKYHKVKLSRLIGDICAAPDENTRGTVLDASNGALFHELFQCNEDVKKVLEAYAGRGGGDSAASTSGKAPTASASPSPPASPTRGEAAAAQPDGAGASPPVQAADAATAPTPVRGASVATSSAVDLSVAASGNGAAAAAHGDSDNDEGSFEAKLPWSMDD